MVGWLIILLVLSMFIVPSCAVFWPERKQKQVDKSEHKSILVVLTHSFTTLLLWLEPCCAAIGMHYLVKGHLMVSYSNFAVIKN